MMLYYNKKHGKLTTFHTNIGCHGARKSMAEDEARLYLGKEPRICEICAKPKHLVIVERSPAVTKTATLPTTVQPRSLIMPRGNFGDYMIGLITEADHDVHRAERAVADAENRINDLPGVLEAKAGLEAAERLADDDQVYRWRRALQQRERSGRLRLTRMKRALKRTQHFRDALHQGYVPIPRLPAVNLRWCYQLIPPDVLDAFTEAKEAGLFEEFRIIDGRNTIGRSGVPAPEQPRTLARVDPVLVGMIGDELFAVAWWR